MRLVGSNHTREDREVTIQRDIRNPRGLGRRDQGALGLLEIERAKAHLEGKDAESLQEGNAETVARVLQGTMGKRMVQMTQEGSLRVTKTHLVKVLLVALVIMTVRAKGFKVMLIHSYSDLQLSE